MRKFSFWVAFWLGLVFLPIYFLWVVACIGAGYWFPAGIFSWSAGARAFVAIWFIIATLISIGAVLQVL